MDEGLSSMRADRRAFSGITSEQAFFILKANKKAVEHGSQASSEMRALAWWS